MMWTGGADGGSSSSFHSSVFTGFCISWCSPERCGILRPVPTGLATDCDSRGPAFVRATRYESLIQRLRESLDETNARIQAECPDLNPPPRFRGLNPHSRRGEL